MSHIVFCDAEVIADISQYHVCWFPLQNDASYRACHYTLPDWKFPLCLRRVFEITSQLQPGVIPPPNGHTAWSHTGAPIYTVLSPSLKREVREPWTYFRTPSTAVLRQLSFDGIRVVMNPQCFSSSHINCVQGVKEPKMNSFILGKHLQLIAICRKYRNLGGFWSSLYRVSYGSLGVICSIISLNMGVFNIGNLTNKK